MLCPGALASAQAAGERALPHTGEVEGVIRGARPVHPGIGPGCAREGRPPLARPAHPMEPTQVGPHEGVEVVASFLCRECRFFGMNNAQTWVKKKVGYQ